MYFLTNLAQTNNLQNAKINKSLTKVEMLGKYASISATIPFS